MGMHCYLFTSQQITHMEFFQDPRVQSPKQQAQGELLSGVAEYYSKNYQAAIKHFEKAISISPKNSEAYRYLGEIECDLGNFKKAIGYFDKAIDADPGNGLAYIGRGDAKLLAKLPGGREDLETGARILDRKKKGGEIFLVPEVEKK
jgi:tetratricopeptide (TPR) repeat protein